MKCVSIMKLRYMHHVMRKASCFTGKKPVNAYGMSLKVTADVLHNDGDILELAGLKIKAIHTPGHTAGGTCYYIESDKTLMSGDTLLPVQ